MVNTGAAGRIPPPHGRELLIPLFPSAHFRVWGRVWGRRTGYPRRRSSAPEYHVTTCPRKQATFTQGPRTTKDENRRVWQTGTAGVRHNDRRGVGQLADGDRHRYEPVPLRSASMLIGGSLPGQPPERREALSRQDAQGK